MTTKEVNDLVSLVLSSLDANERPLNSGDFHQIGIDDPDIIAHCMYLSEQYRNNPINNLPAPEYVVAYRTENIGIRVKVFTDYGAANDLYNILNEVCEVKLIEV